MYAGIRDDSLEWYCKKSGCSDYIDGLKRLGLRGLEIHVDRSLRAPDYSKPASAKGATVDLGDPAVARRVKEIFTEAGVTVSAVLIENDFGRENIEAEIDWMIGAARVAESLGTDVVRINSVMSPSPEISREKYVDRVVGALRQALRETHATCFAIENHGVMGNEPEFIRAVLRGVSDQRLGLTLDTGNFYWAGYPLSTVYDLVKEFAPSTLHTHLKNMTFSPAEREKRRDWCRDWPKEARPLYEGDIDYSKVFETLQAAGYGRDVTIEDESLGNYPAQEAIEILQRDAKYVQGLLEKLRKPAD